MRIAIITARANSKGIANKNLRRVGGASLLARSISAAHLSEEFDEIVVTTDGDSIAEEAIKHNAKVVMRPADLALDTSKSIDAVLHVFGVLKINKGISVLLQPTSPLREALDIKESLRIFREKGFGSVVSCTECDHHPYKVFSREGDEYMPVKDFSTLEMPRQMLPKFYRPNGAIYVNRIEDLIASKTFYCTPVHLYEMPPQRSIDIDTELDLVTANFLIGEEYAKKF